MKTHLPFFARGRSFACAPQLFALALSIVLIGQSALAARISSDPESVTVKVVDSQRTKLKGKDVYQVKVSAKVLKIERSASGLKVGDSITISYYQDLGRAGEDAKKFKRDKAAGEIVIGAGVFYQTPPLLKKGEIWKLAMKRGGTGEYLPDEVSLDGFQRKARS